MNPYVELGIGPTATLDELKHAYRRAVLRYHPDSAHGQGDPEKFNAVLQAYRILQRKYEKASASPKAGQPPGQPPPRPRPQGRSKTKIEVDQTTIQLPMEILIHYLEQTDNPYVRMIAIEAVALKNNPMAVRYLGDLLHRADTNTQRYVIRTLGEVSLWQAYATLLPWISSPDFEIAIESVKSLEKMTLENRVKIIQQLQNETESFLGSLFAPLRGTWEWLQSPRKSTPQLGQILLDDKYLTSEQLKIALLLQKRHPYLLGEILGKLEYIGSTEIQKALAVQSRATPR